MLLTYHISFIYHTHTPLVGLNTITVRGLSYVKRNLAPTIYIYIYIDLKC